MANDFELKRRMTVTSTDTITLQTDNTSPDIVNHHASNTGYVVTTIGTATLINFWGARAKKDQNGKVSPGTYGQIKDSSNANVTQALTAGGAYVFPDQCFPFHYIQMRVDTGTTTVVELSPKG